MTRRTPRGPERPRTRHATPLVTTRNASFQQWQSYLTNRSKRTHARRFLVQGVRPITLALESGWPVESVLYRVGGAQLSSWARGVLDTVAAEQASAEKIGVGADLMAELGEKDSAPPELILVARSRTSRLADLKLGSAPLVVVFDRPSSPGNLGTLVRSADAFGADALVVTGHAADLFDPQCVRASTGSVFALPVAVAADAAEVIAFRDAKRGAGVDMAVVGTDESGSITLYDNDFARGTILVVGNETRGMSAAWRDACDTVVNIPIGGAASSLGAPSAGAVCLYEVARQRRSLK